MIQPEQIAALLNHPLRDRIPVLEDLPADPVQRVVALRKSFPEAIVPAVIELSELRFRAKAKFQEPEKLFFDRQALEQATSRAVAAWRADEYSGCETVSDLTCGIGGDALGLAGSGHKKALASDVNGARVAMAAENAKALGVSDSIDFRVSAAENYRKSDGYFIDPDRRASGRRTRHLEGIAPGLPLIRELRDRSEYVGVKLSPATPDSELEDLGGSLDFVSHEGSCKEAFARFGKLERAARRAVVIRGDTVAILESSPDAPEAPLSRHLKYIFEPDPAVVRAGLIDELCQKIGAAVMDRQIAYLTTDDFVDTTLGNCYETLASLPFSEKALKGALKGLGIGRVEVKKRGTAVDLESIRKRLQSDLPGHGVVFMTRIGIKPWAYVCRVKPHE